MTEKLESRKAFIINFLYAAIFVGLYYFFVKYALGYIFPFVFAAGLAILLRRPVKFISRKLHIKTHSTVSIILVLSIVLLIVGALFLIGTVVVRELKEFVGFMTSQFSSVDEVLATVEEFVMRLVIKLPASVAQTAGEYVTNFFDKFTLGSTAVSDSVAEAVGNAAAEGGQVIVQTSSSGFDFSVLSAPLSGAWNVVKGLPSLLLSIIVTIISCVFMTADYDNISTLILGMLSKEKGKRLVNSKNTVTKGVAKLVKAYATLMLITFTEMFVGLYFMRFIGVYTGSYIAIISLVTCVVDIIPVLGTGTVLLPWAIISFVTGKVGLGIGLLVLYGVITVLRQIIEPKLVANEVGLPAIATIMAMFIGAKIFGAFGIVILPLTVIILKLMYDEGVVGSKKLSDEGQWESEEEISHTLSETNEETGEIIE